MKIKHTRVIDWCNHCPSPKSHDQYPISTIVTCAFCGEESRCDKHRDIGMTNYDGQLANWNFETLSICTACHLKDSRRKNPIYPKLVKHLELIQDANQREGAYIKECREKIKEYSAAYTALKHSLKPYRKQPKY